MVIIRLFISKFPLRVGYVPPELPPSAHPPPRAVLGPPTNPAATAITTTTYTHSPNHHKSVNLLST